VNKNSPVSPWLSTSSADVNDGTAFIPWIHELKRHSTKKHC
jgi:hypothetical protein